ncbi:MAG: hypothetical protein V3W41_21830, partial [Planctomycetota bacterium]
MPGTRLFKRRADGHQYGIGASVRARRFALDHEDVHQLPQLCGVVGKAVVGLVVAANQLASTVVWSTKVGALVM